MNALQDLRFDAVFDVAIESSIEWLNDNFAFFFDTLRTGLDGALFALNWALGFPWLIFIVLTALACWRLSGWGLALFSVISLVLCWQAGLWEMLIETLALVLLATLIALAIAIPLGIAGARWSRLGKALKPVMDTLQTLPPYVYLLPAIALIGYGGASAVMAIVLSTIGPHWSPHAVLAVCCVAGGAVAPGLPRPVPGFACLCHGALIPVRNPCPVWGWPPVLVYCGRCRRRARPGRSLSGRTM